MKNNCQREPEDFDIISWNEGLLRIITICINAIPGWIYSCANCKLH